MNQYPMIYAGIGSRDASSQSLARASSIASSLAAAGWTLRSGGARGMDQAFASGAVPLTEIFGADPINRIPGEAYAIARDSHPAWNRCKPYVRSLMARNVQILLGGSLQVPVDMVLYGMVPGGSRGTEHTLRIASRFQIAAIDIESIADWNLPSELVAELLEMRARSRVAATGLGSEPLPQP